MSFSVMYAEASLSSSVSSSQNKTLKSLVCQYADDCYIGKSKLHTFEANSLGSEERCMFAVSVTTKH